MTEKISFNRTFQLLENAMDIAHQRHNVMTSNISNIDTPGYRPKDIDFKSAMSQAMNPGHTVRLTATHEGHMGRQPESTVKADVFEEKGEWNGFNYMDSDRLITNMTENNLIYKTATETLLRKIAIMKEIIREGGR